MFVAACIPTRKHFSLLIPRPRFNQLTLSPCTVPIDIWAPEHAGSTTVCVGAKLFMYAPVASNSSSTTNVNKLRATTRV